MKFQVASNFHWSTLFFASADKLAEDILGECTQTKGFKV